MSTAQQLLWFSFTALFLYEAVAFKPKEIPFAQDLGHIAAAVMEVGGEKLGSDQANSRRSHAVTPAPLPGSPQGFRKQAVNKHLRRYRRFTVANTW